MTKNSLLIVGSIALDTIETSAGRRENILGGSTTYAMAAAGRSAAVHIVGIVGDDFPQEGHTFYRNWSSDLSDFKIVAGSTFRWGGHYHANGDDRDTLFTNLGVFREFNPQLNPGNRKIPVVFLANIHPALQSSVIAQSDPRAIIITDTMNLWIGTTKAQLLEVLQRTEVLLINETEAQQLAGTNSIETAAGILQDLGPKVVVIKLGSKGARLFSPEAELSIGIYPVKQVIDPTGAGDTFGGGFAAALANGRSYREALINGSALASFCVEDFGVTALAGASESAIQERCDCLQQTLRP